MALDIILHISGLQMIDYTFNIVQYDQFIIDKNL